MFARLIVYAVAIFLVLTGLSMLIGGQLWYDRTPGVTMTGPFNAHLVLDIGYAYLASGLVLAAGGWLASRHLMSAGLLWPGLHALVHLVGLSVHGPASTAALLTEAFGVIAPVLLAAFALFYVPAGRPGLGGRGVLHALTERFERRWSYDAGFLHEIIETAPETLVRFQTFQGLAEFQGAAPQELIAGATLCAYLEEDCGPCAQLTIDMLIDQGINPSLLRALIDQRYEDASADAALGFRFAGALMRRDPEIEPIRNMVVHQYGVSAALAVAYAVLVARSYPLLKRALGHDQACLRLDVAGQSQTLARS